MEVQDAITLRRTIKKFDPTHTLTEQEITRLMSLARMAPSAFNMQHCRFVCVTDPELKTELRIHSWDQAQVTDCSLLVIICADVMAWKKHREQLWEAAAPHARERVLATIKEYYEGNAQIQRDEAILSCGLAAQTIMLAAQGMGYGTCPMDGFNFEAVARLINLPDDHLVSMFVAIGKPLMEGRPRPGNMEYDQVVIKNRFTA